MRIDSIDAASLRIPFKQSFRHAAASRAATQSIWVRVRDASGRLGIGEGCPREYVTGESVESASAFIAAHAPGLKKDVSDCASLLAWIDAHASAIDADPAAWTAIELALLDLLGKEAGCTVEALIGLAPLAQRFRYTAVVGDLPAQQFERQLERYVASGLRCYKVKLSGDIGRDRAKVHLLRAAGIRPEAVRADANNVWQTPGQAVPYLNALELPFWALEEPLAAGDIEGMAEVARQRNCRIVLDESVARVAQIARLGSDANRWIVNVRVSKMGGIARSLAFVRAARSAGLGIIAGAHAGETSLLTRAALTVAAAAGDALLGQEGAFGTHLLSQDPVQPTLMFGAGGMLEVTPTGVAERPGWGVSARGQ